MARCLAPFLLSHMLRVLLGIGCLQELRTSYLILILVEDSFFIRHKFLAALSGSRGRSPPRWLIDL